MIEKITYSIIMFMMKSIMVIAPILMFLFGIGLIIGPLITSIIEKDAMILFWYLLALPFGFLMLSGSLDMFKDLKKY